MYKGIKISNLVCLIIGIIAFVILVTLATIMSYEYLSLLSKGSQSGDSSSGAAGWGMAFGIIFYLFSKHKQCQKSCLLILLISNNLQNQVPHYL